MGLDTQRIGPKNGGGDTAKQHLKKKDHVNEVRMIVQEAESEDQPEERVVRVAKSALAVEELRRITNKEGSNATMVKALEDSEDELRRNVEQLVNNKNAFAQQLVVLYNKGASDAMSVMQAREPAGKKHKTLDTENMYARIIADLNNIAERALVPLITFTGMVANKMRESDIRQFLVYRTDNAPIEQRLRVFDTSATTRESFLETVRDAGPVLTTMFLSTIEEEASREIAAVDAADKIKYGNSYIEACFDLDEMDMDDMTHPGYHTRDLRAGVNRDDNAIKKLREELVLVEASITAERARSPQTIMLEQTRAVDAKREELRIARRAGSADLIARLQRELDREEALLLALNVEPRARIHRFEARAQAIRDEIIRLQNTSANRVVLNEARAIMTEVNISTVERRFAPAWAFQVIGSAIFRRVLSATTIASFEAALAQVKRIPGCANFEMKELICSPSVADMFAFLVSSNFLSSGDGNDTKRSSSSSAKAFDNKYLNVTRMRDILAAKVMTCKIWFESVSKRANPLVAEFKTKLDKLLADKRRAAGNNAATLTAISEWEARMKTYQAMLPPYELVYYE